MGKLFGSVPWRLGPATRREVGDGRAPSLGAPLCAPACAAVGRWCAGRAADITSKLFGSSALATRARGQEGGGDVRSAPRVPCARLCVAHSGKGGRQRCAFRAPSALSVRVWPAAASGGVLVATAPTQDPGGGAQQRRGLSLRASWALGRDTSVYGATGGVYSTAASTRGWPTVFAS